MRGMADECIDLIYLDPPFNTNRRFDAPIGTEAEGSGFDDIWKWTAISDTRLERMKKEDDGLYSIVHSALISHSKAMGAYLSYMADRLIEMKRILKETGSIFLHCDDNAGFWLKVLMDYLFGRDEYYASVIWQKTSAHNDKLFGDVSDFLFAYGDVSKKPDDVRIDLDPEYVKNNYRFKDEHGNYSSADLTGPGTTEGESGKPWKGHDPGSVGRHWNTPKSGQYARYIDSELIPGYKNIEGVHARLNALDEAGLVLWPEKAGKVPRLKRYLMPNQKQLPTNIWLDIPPVSAKSDEDVGYETQKPVLLLQRVIRASSNEGDVILDPFCGCATACVAAEIEHRQWIGIDVSPMAYELVKSRLKREVNVGEIEDKGDHVSMFDTKTIHRTDTPSDRTGKKSKGIKNFLYGIQEGYCNGCLNHFHLRNMTEDHIVPQGKGGPDTDDNIQLLCGYCNSKKGVNRTHDELVAILIEEGVRK